MNTTEVKCGKQRLPLPRIQFDATSGSQYIMLIHIELAYSRCLIQAFKHLCDNIANR